MNDAELLARPDEGPSLAALQRLYGETSPITAQGWNRINDAEDARYCLWPGQSADGRKWDDNSTDGEPVRPFNGASDFRPLVIDDAIVLLKDLLMLAAKRTLRADSTSSSGQGAHLRRYLNYLTRTRLVDRLWRQIELFANHFLTYPLAALHVCWRFEVGWRWQNVTREDLFALEQLAQGSLDGLSDAINDPAQQDNAAATVQALYKGYASARVPEWTEFEMPALSLAEARKLVKELREDGRSKLKMPYVCANHPELEALKPWEEFIVPEWACDLDQAPVFLRFFLTRPELERMAATEQWNEDFLKAVLDRPGVSVWTARQQARGRWDVSRTLNDDQYLHEIVYCYRKATDSDGITGVYETVFHTDVTGDDGNLVGRHGLSEDARNKVPLALAAFEAIDKPLLSGRSLPEILNPPQTQIKQHTDLQTNRTAFVTCPPIIQYQHGSLGYDTQEPQEDFGPFARYLASTPQRAPHFMAVDGGTAIESKDLVAWMTVLLDRRVGRRVPGSEPDESIARLESVVGRFLTALSEAFQQMVQLTAQYLPVDQWRAIVGEDAEPLPSDPDRIAQEFDYLLEFDVRTINPEFMAEQIKQLGEIGAQDRSGRWDWGQFTELAASTINPMLAKRLVRPAAEATEQLRRGVKEDITQMRAGILPDLVENDATAPVKLQFMWEIIESSPELQDALKNDPNFSERAQQYEKNLNQSAMQMGENKTTGRLGVASNEAVQAPMPG